MYPDSKRLYQAIAELSRQLGFADFGCAAAHELPQPVKERYAETMDKGYFAEMRYLHENMDKRFDPRLMVEGAKSVLVFLVPYSFPEQEGPRPQGISQYALGKDYHYVIKNRLQGIMDLLREFDPAFEGRAFTDSAPVLERVWAVKAGLGFIGKNNFLISRKAGLKNFIGTIISNVEVPPTRDMEPEREFAELGKNYCGNCTRCLDACPSGALCRPYTLDAGRCISYLTIENRHLPDDIQSPDRELPDFKGAWFGCDRCSDACPWNSRNLPGWAEFRANLDIFAHADHGWWENMTGGEFKRLFKDSPLSRGGLKNIRAALTWNKINGKEE